ncbi:MAG TPA: DUF4393 domain-containing protein [Albidovulum sp.]|uniref:DUF4393 domain-containing protein n=1 Tax=Albidovulum sp. TaxID=1872424 RepID=UPI002B8CB27C|nr:DUF4393 domain-containing protein [Albidovulum sp.]
MSEKRESGNISDAMNAAANLANAVPIYQDALQPVARQAGMALETVGQCVNVALLPVRGLVWGAHQVEEWVSSKVSRILKDIEPEKIVTPDLSIAGPTVEALKYTGHKDELSDMFAGLLATAMNSDEMQHAHPSFVSIISAMSVFDARVIKAISDQEIVASSILRLDNEKREGIDIRTHFSPSLYRDCGVRSGEDADRFHASIDNLERLGLVDARYTRHLVLDGAYTEIEESDEIQRARSQMDAVGDGRKLTIVKGSIELSMFGKSFSNACLKYHA